MSRVFITALFAAAVQARFGQEQGNGAITAIGALTDLGTSGQAATLAGGSIQFLLAAANPCGKLTQADQIIAQLGTSDAAVAAARGLVAAEQNFNPFVVSIPSICSDPSLPASPELRGVVPLIDPAVGGSDLENSNSATSKTTPFDATGLSVAQFEAGLNGRKETESTFQAIDPQVNKGQQEALNPAIIMNRIKDQLTNVCGANQAAKDAAVAALATVSATGKRDVTAADQWNTLLGFAGTNTNPDNAPQTGLVGHT
ncbi:hypothetical protein F503_08720 [Ophiostoma piceae UAMH 11346]|uniref:Circumsporozoite protein n=1 Tax=Ophiostoma piceae (strain UAMH 11346) TaxID=1262450 RepID=S3BUJ8_OPHP1|nr:hypothetical protein F503_08720 [Ophiostoma piceae UAMH 11346]